jgi:hypothetical protein
MESKIIPTEGFLRSESNPGAVVNVDNKALQVYKNQREATRLKQQEINSLRSEVDQLKSMMSQLLEKIK